MGKNKNSVRKIQGFQKNKKTGHVSYAFWQKGINVKSLGFTHSDKKGYESKTLLTHNINPFDNRDCYVKNDIENYKYTNYKSSDKYKNYRIHPEDRKTIFDLMFKNKKR